MFYCVLLGFSRYYWVLLGFTGFYCVKPCFVGFYWISEGITGFYSFGLDLIGFYRVLLGFYWMFTGLWWFPLVFNGFAGSQLGFYRTRPGCNGDYDFAHWGFFFEFLLDPRGTVSATCRGISAGRASPWQPMTDACRLFFYRRRRDDKSKTSNLQRPVVSTLRPSPRTVSSLLPSFFFSLFSLFLLLLLRRRRRRLVTEFFVTEFSIGCVR